MENKDTATPAQPARFTVAASSLRQQEALDAIVGERSYQETRWNAKTTASEGKHSVTEFIVFIEHYLANAKRVLSTRAEPGATNEALHDVRKVAALAVAAMEQNGVYRRAVPAAPAAQEAKK